QPIPEPTTPPGPEEKKKGLTDTQRQLLATAIQVGLPLALAGFGGQRGLAAGAGLAKGFGEAATARAKIAGKKTERETKEKAEQQRIDIQKQQAKTQKELAKLKELETAAKLTPTKKGLFREQEPSLEEILKTVESLRALSPRTAGVEQAEKVKKATEKAKPINVIDPQGNPGTIPASQLDAALKQGFKRR
ncbi:unnamed protein product, partial [marine sediment metagenome]